MFWIKLLSIIANECRTFMWIMMRRRTMCRTKHHWRSSSSLCFRSVGANDNLKVRLCDDHKLPNQLQLRALGVSTCSFYLFSTVTHAVPRLAGCTMPKAVQMRTLCCSLYFPLSTDASLFTYRTYVHGCPPFLAPAT